MRLNRHPLSHDPTVAGIKGLAEAGVDQLIDSLFRELDNQTAAAVHGKNFAVHFEAVRRHQIAGRDGRMLAKSLNDGQKSGVYGSGLAGRGTVRRHERYRTLAKSQ